MSLSNLSKLNGMSVLKGGNERIRGNDHIKWYQFLRIVYFEKNVSI